MKGGERKEGRGKRMKEEEGENANPMASGNLQINVDCYMYV